MCNGINILFFIKIEETRYLKQFKKIHFNGDVYEQIDGVTMSSQKAPGLVNISMGYHGQHSVSFVISATLEKMSRLYILSI